jgi:transcriptional regulator with XRE-family HTH domain
MKALDIKKTRRDLNLNQTEFGKLFGVGIRTVQLWESGDRMMTDSVKIILDNYLKGEHGTGLESSLTSEEIVVLRDLASDVIKNHHKLLQVEIYGLWFEVESQKRAIQILKE